MKAIVTSALIATAALTLSGCDSQGTKEVKEQAKAIEQSYDAQADLIEAGAKNAPENAADAAENKADALRDTGEAVKDKLIKDQKQVQKDTQ